MIAPASVWKSRLLLVLNDSRANSSRPIIRDEPAFTTSGWRLFRGGIRCGNAVREKSSNREIRNARNLRDASPFSAPTVSVAKAKLSALTYLTPTPLGPAGIAATPVFSNRSGRLEAAFAGSSEERRVGDEWVSTCRSR